MTEEAPRPTYELSSVDRALTILTILGRCPGIRLGELSRQLGANTSTVLRALRVLERHGLVRRGQSDVEYLLGTRLVELGQAAASSIAIVPSLRPLVAPLTHDFHATAHIGMLRDGMVTIVDKVDPPDPTVGYSAVGTRMPLHATAGGKAALALVGAPLLDDLRGAALQRFTPHTLCDVGALSAEIEAVRARRFSVERGEYHVGFGCVGSAISVDRDVYTVSISGSLTDVDALQHWGERLREAIEVFLLQHAGAASGI